MRYRLLVGLAVATCLSTNLAYAQKRPVRRAVPAPKKATPKPDPIRMMLGAISMNSVRPDEDLHATCRRSDFKLLAWGLEGMKDRIQLEKGEYETAAEFGERRGKLEGLINQGSDVVVCQPIDDNEDAPFRYDPENEKFAGSFKSRQNVWRDVKRTGSYVSKTRMGVRATVTSSIEFDYDVDMSSVLGSRPPKCIKYSYVDYDYEVRSPRASAPLLKARGYLVFVGKLVSPFIDVSDTPGSPTLDDPHDLFQRTLTVSFAPRLAAIVWAGW
ncbi:MAG: hypothetical protein WDN24_15570 [Sphingomonas sp.]